MPKFSIPFLKFRERKKQLLLKKKERSLKEKVRDYGEALRKGREAGWTPTQIRTFESARKDVVDQLKQTRQQRAELLERMPPVPTRPAKKIPRVPLRIPHVPAKPPAVPVGEWETLLKSVEGIPIREELPPRIKTVVRKYGLPAVVPPDPRVENVAEKYEKLKKLGFVGIRTPDAAYKKALKTFTTWQVRQIKTGKIPTEAQKQKVVNLLKTAVKQLK